MIWEVWRWFGFPNSLACIQPIEARPCCYVLIMKKTDGSFPYDYASIDDMGECPRGTLLSAGDQQRIFSRCEEWCCGSRYDERHGSVRR